jgi:hypothetical protein
MLEPVPPIPYRIHRAEPHEVEEARQKSDAILKRARELLRGTIPPDEL